MTKDQAINLLLEGELLYTECGRFPSLNDEDDVKSVIELYFGEGSSSDGRSIKTNTDYIWCWPTTAGDVPNNCESDFVYRRTDGEIIYLYELTD